MLARALIVILLVLNLGVALWWSVRTAPVPPTPDPADTDLPLRLVRAAATAAEPAATTITPAPAPAPAPASPGTAPAPATATPPVPQAASELRCLRLGPFATRTVAEALRDELGARLRQSSVEEMPGESASYRVLLPPAADRAQAQATVDRIAAAGFQDYLILNQGEDMHAVALGAFRSRETAERRVASLQAAGFPAQLRPQGTPTPSRWWLDVATAESDAVRARVQRVQERDCARLR